MTMRVTYSRHRRAPRGRASRHALPAHSPISGFTLLEILVAVAVFAIFSAMAYGGLMRLIDSRERVEAERAYWREAALAFVRMDRDFSLARNRPIRDYDGSQQPAFEGQPTDPRELGDPNVEFTRGGVLVPNGFTADLQRVGYRLVDGNLMRITWPVLDRAPATKPDAAPILHDVEEFQVRFYERNSGTWLDRWPPIGTNTFPWGPPAVEVTVALKGRAKYTRVFLVGGDK